MIDYSERYTENPPEALAPRTKLRRRFLEFIGGALVIGMVLFEMVYCLCGLLDQQYP